MHISDSLNEKKRTREEPIPISVIYTEKEFLLFNWTYKVVTKVLCYIIFKVKSRRVRRKSKDLHRTCKTFIKFAVWIIKYEWRQHIFCGWWSFSVIESDYGLSKQHRNGCTKEEIDIFLLTENLETAATVRQCICHSHHMATWKFDSRSKVKPG